MSRQAPHTANPVGCGPAAQWRQLRPDDRDGFVVVMRPVNRPGRGRYWCGPIDPDSSVTWLRHRDWLTGEVIVPARLAVFASAWDATVAWGRYLADRRRRGVPVLEFAHFFPLERIADWSRVPPISGSSNRPRLLRPGRRARQFLELSGV